MSQNKKRLRPQENLGASEFASTLQCDDNPSAIHRVLTRFVRVVRQERAVALRSIDDDDDDDNNNTDSEDEEPLQVLPSLKRRKEQDDWKSDTANYNVPFVGTSVVSARPTTGGGVVSGVWPTGLLLDYLTKSPLAVEMTSDLLLHGSRLYKRQLGGGSNNTKAQITLYKAYLKALRELVTAAIPTKKLQTDKELIADEQHEPESSSPSQYERMIAQVVGKRLPGLVVTLQEEMGRGKGKASAVGGCGDLAPLVLQVLTSLAKTSVKTARAVARTLEMCSLAFVIREQSNKATGPVTARDKARVSAMELAVSLLEYDDWLVGSLITTQGSKDRKVVPGILVDVLRDGITASLSAPGMVSLLEKLLRLLRTKLSSSFRNACAQLFTTHTMENLSRLSALAPVLSDPFLSVLKGEDSYDSLSDPEKAGVEARRLVLTVLCDSEHSPLFGRHDTDKRSRALLLLFRDQRGIGMSRIMLRCISITPELLPSLFRSLDVPDCNRTSPFLKTLGMVSLLLQHGPSECWTIPKVDLASCIFPLNFRKQDISRALLSSNTLIVSETLKFIVRACDRFLEVSEKSSRALAVDDVNAFVQRIPDIQVLIGIVSRFDMLQTPAGSLVTSWVCLVLRRLYRTSANLFSESAFDCMKLLPRDRVGFCSTPIGSQLAVLTCVKELVAAQVRVIAVWFRLIGMLGIDTFS